MSIIIKRIPQVGLLPSLGFQRGLYCKIYCILGKDLVNNHTVTRLSLASDPCVELQVLIQVVTQAEPRKLVAAELEVDAMTD